MKKKGPDDSEGQQDRDGSAKLPVVFSPEADAFLEQVVHAHIAEEAADAVFAARVRETTGREPNFLDRWLQQAPDSAVTSGDTGPQGVGPIIRMTGLVIDDAESGVTVASMDVDPNTGAVVHAIKATLDPDGTMHQTDDDALPAVWPVSPPPLLLVEDED